MPYKNACRVALVLILFGSFFSVSCDIFNPDTQGEIPLSATRYEQILLLEKFTGTWCGWCPDGITYAENLKAAYNDLIVLNYHVSDIYSLSEADSILDYIRDYTGVPAGVVQRSPLSNYTPADQLTYGRGYWSSLASGAYSSEGVPVGIAINTVISGTDLSIDISVYYSQGYDDSLYLTAILSESGVIGSQSNYLNDDPNSDYYQMGSQISDFEHNHLIRDVISSSSGDRLAAIEAVEDASYNISLDSNWNSANLEITVFVHLMEEDDKSILNARRVSAGESVGPGVLP